MNECQRPSADPNPLSPPSGCLPPAEVPCPLCVPLRLSLPCWPTSGPTSAAGGWVSELLALAGGEDVLGAPGAWPHALTPEDLGRSDPSVLILAPVGMDLPSALAAARSLAAQPGWQALRAAREGQVHVADGAALFGRPGPQVAETLETIAEMLHPAAFRFGHEGRAWTRLDGGFGT